MKNETFRVDSEWSQAMDKGWGSGIVTDNGNLIVADTARLKGLAPFIEEEVPQLLEDFYDLMVKKMAVHLINAGWPDLVAEDVALEFAEELLSPGLNEILIWMAGWTKPELLEQCND